MTRFAAWGLTGTLLLVLGLAGCYSDDNLSAPDGQDDPGMDDRPSNERPLDDLVEPYDEHPNPFPIETPVVVECAVDEDCAIRNLGSCCGSYVRCVKNTYEPDLTQMAERCAQNDIPCSYSEQQINGCLCEQGQCVNDYYNPAQDGPWTPSEEFNRAKFGEDQGGPGQ